MRSAIYEGSVVHHRRGPVERRFSYRTVMTYVDLDELDEVCSLHPLWSLERTNAVSFRRRDYLPGRAGPLAEAVRELVEERTGRRPGGPIAMLTHPRTWGWVFNPITLYYCFDRDGGRVQDLVAEVTNTPWHERHAYVVGAPGEHRFAKQLHVSPFFDMDMDYELAYGEPGQCACLRMRTVRGDETLFEAGLRLKRRPMNREELGRLVWRQGLATVRVSAGIYRQAFGLWRAGAAFVAHPDRRRAPADSTGPFAGARRAPATTGPASPPSPARERCGA